MSQEFKVGDRVRFIRYDRYYTPSLEHRIGLTGTIIGWRNSVEVQVEFDEVINGHDCGGLCKDGYGQNMYPKDLELINEFKVGDRVQFKTWEELEKIGKISAEGDVVLNGRMGFPKAMKHLCGTYATIKSIKTKVDNVELKDFTASGDTHWHFSLDMLKLATNKEIEWGSIVRVKENGKIAVVTFIDTDGIPYKVHFKDNDDYDWCNKDEIELISSVEPTKTTEPVKTEPVKVIPKDNGLSCEVNHILNNLQDYRYLARDYSGKLFAYKDMPSIDICGTQFYSKAGYKEVLQRDLFGFIKWENSPMEINKILKGGN